MALCSLVFDVNCQLILHETYLLWDDGHIKCFFCNFIYGVWYLGLVEGVCIIEIYSYSQYTWHLLDVFRWDMSKHGISMFGAFENRT